MKFKLPIPWARFPARAMLQYTVSTQKLKPTKHKIQSTQVQILARLVHVNGMQECNFVCYLCVNQRSSNAA